MGVGGAIFEEVGPELEGDSGKVWAGDSSDKRLLWIGLEGFSSEL